MSSHGALSTSLVKVREKQWSFPNFDGNEIMKLGRWSNSYVLHDTYLMCFVWYLCCIIYNKHLFNFVFFVCVPFIRIICPNKLMNWIELKLSIMSQIIIVLQLTWQPFNINWVIFHNSQNSWNVKSSKYWNFGKDIKWCLPECLLLYSQQVCR